MPDRWLLPVEVRARCGDLWGRATLVIQLVMIWQIMVGHTLYDLDHLVEVLAEIGKCGLSLILEVPSFGRAESNILSLILLQKHPPILGANA